MDLFYDAAGNIVGYIDTAGAYVRFHYHNAVAVPQRISLVMAMADRDELINQVKGLLSSIPSDTGEVVFGDDQYEAKMAFVPGSPNFCGFSLTISTYGTYGFCFGNGLAFEDISIDEYPPKDVVQAVLRGHVRETVWRIGKKVAKSEGEIQLADGRLLQDRAFLSFRGILGFGRQEQVMYKPVFDLTYLQQN